MKSVNLGIKFKKIFKFLIIWFCFIDNINGQFIISGVVQDSLSNKLEFVNAILTISSSKKIINFDITDEDGRFEMTSNTPKDSLLIIFSHIAYKNDSVFLVNVQSIQNIFVVLKPNNFELEEVQVQEKTNFVRRKDTISYNLDYYRDSTEQNIGELLRKIPGIKVDEFGNISVYSKSINTLTIDGVNITKNKYQVISSSLRADIVEKAEIIFNYMENDLLQSFFASTDELSINLITKKKYRNSTTGNADLGLGYKNYDLIANVFSLGKAIKLISSTDLNNIGRGAQKIISLKNNLLPPNNLNVDFSSSWSNRYSNYERELTRKNNLLKSRIDAVLFPALKNTKINLNLEGNIEDFNQLSVINYYNYNTGLYRIDENNLKNKIRDFSTGLFFSKNIKKNQQLNFLFNYDYTGAHNKYLINNSNWTILNQRKDANGKFQYLNRISTNKIIISEIEVNNKEANLDFNFLFTPFEHEKYKFSSPYTKNVNSSLFSIKMNQSLYIKSIKNILGFRVDYENYSIGLHNNNMDDQNKLSNYSLSVQENYNYSTKGEIKGVVSLGYLEDKMFKLNPSFNKTDRPYFNLNLNWKQSFNRHLDGRIFLTKNNDIESIQYSKSPIWTAPFNLQNNAYPFRPIKNVSFGHLLNYISNYPSIHISNTFSYHLTDYNFIEADSIIGSSIVTEKLFNINKQYQLKGKLQFDCFIEPIHTAFKSSTSFSQGKLPFMTNGNFTNSMSKIWSESISFRTAFIFPLNFDLGIEYYHFNIENTIISSKVNNYTTYQKNYIDLIIKLKKVSLNFKNYLFQTKNYKAESSTNNYISDLDLNFHFAKSTLDIVVYNLFDKDHLQYISKTFSGEIVSQTNINSRTLLIKYKLKF